MTSTKTDIRAIVDRIIADGSITRAEQRMFNEWVMADGLIDQDEHDQVVRLRALLAAGQLKVVD
jgi:hypothetical protein